MKAIQLSSPSTLDTLRLVDLADPGSPKAGEVRVAIRASSLNYHDMGVAAGKLPAAENRIPLADASGIVEAIGEGVKSLTIGDHVISRFFPTWDAGEPTIPNFATTPGDGRDGYAAEIVVRPAHHFARAPRHLNHQQAATVPVAAVTAWRALVTEGKLKSGDTVLVLGTGGVSIVALQIAKATGARVIATTSSDEKAARLRQLGADEVINYRTTPEWGQAVLDLTSGRGVDHVLEVGGPGTLQQSITAVRLGGNIFMLGILTGFGGEVSTAAITMKQATVKGIVVGSLEHQEQTVRALEAARIMPIIDRVFPLSHLSEAFQFQAQGKHFGKVAITL